MTCETPAQHGVQAPKASKQTVGDSSPSPGRYPGRRAKSDAWLSRHAAKNASSAPSHGPGFQRSLLTDAGALELLEPCLPQSLHEIGGHLAVVGRLMARSAS